MKSTASFKPDRIRWLAVGVGFSLAVFAASAAETNAPVAAPAALTPEQMFEGGTNAYNNWVDLSAGGFFTGGNKAQAQQSRQNSRGAFGGIEDFHFQGEVSKGTTFTTDGRALFDNH